MRLACDLDGVLADLGAALGREAGRLFPDAGRPVEAPPGPGVPSADARGGAPQAQERQEGGGGLVPDAGADAHALLGAGAPALSPRQEGLVWRTVLAIDNFWETLDECEPGSIRRLYATARERRWDVVFVTSRPASAGDTVQRQSQRWLERHGFELPSVLAMHGNRGRLASALALDVFIDDRPEHCLDVAVESGARAILLWRDAGAAIPASARRLDIGAVPSMSACLDLLADAGRGDTQDGVLGRLRQLLGLTGRTGTRRA